jgi:hypothetical protein
VRSAHALGVRVLARLLLPLLLVALSFGHVSAVDPLDSCVFLPPNMPTISPDLENRACQAFDKAWPDVQDAWWISIGYYGNSDQKPADVVRILEQEVGLPKVTDYGDVAVEGDTDDTRFNTGGSPTHRVIGFGRGLWYVSLVGRPADAAKGQAYARLIDQNILATMAGCVVEGTVTDSFGAPVPDIHVRLHLGEERRDTTTNATGDYEFPGATTSANVSVELIPERQDPANSSTLFQVYFEQRLGSIRTDSFELTDGADCARDFDMRNIAPEYQATDPDETLWPDLIELYQQTWRAWRLSELLGVKLDYGLPLRIFGWCNPAGPELERIGCPKVDPAAPDAFFVGSSVGGSLILRPYIALNPAESVIAQSNPDQVMYHEFGHFFLADVFGDAIRFTPGRKVPHGGYYRNLDSGDAWIEGFADFYQLMVRKHVDGVRRLVFDGENVELDKQPWSLNGQEEELALAGLLLDLEDGAGDYPIARPVAMTVQRMTMSSGHLLVTAVGPLAAIPEDSPVVARFVDGSGTVLERAATVSIPDPATSQAIALFDMFDHRPAKLEIVANVGAAGGAPCKVAAGGGCDDDPIDVELNDLWATIQARDTGLPEFPHVSTVAELYLALGIAYAGDRDVDGADDMAQLFVAHGFYGDTDGGRSDRQFQPGEEIGATSHHERTMKDASGPVTFPAMIPRHSTKPPPESLVTIDTGGVAARIIVNVSFPGELNDQLGYGYVATDHGGRVHVALPPAGLGATISLIATAKGYEPAFLGDIDADAFRVEAESHVGESFQAFTARMVAADGSGPVTGEPGDDPGYELPFDLPLAYVAAGAALLVVLLGFVLVLRRRRSRAPRGSSG